MTVHIVNTNTVAKSVALSVYIKNYLLKYDCNHNVLSKLSGTVASKQDTNAYGRRERVREARLPEGKPTDVIVYPKNDIVRKTENLNCKEQCVSKTIYMNILEL